MTVYIDATAEMKIFFSQSLFLLTLKFMKLANRCTHCIDFPHRACGHGAVNQ